MNNEKSKTLKKDTNKKKKKVSRPLPFFDIFGQSPSFYIGGEDSNTTTTGCIFSVFVITMLIGVAVFYFYRFLVKGEVQIGETTTSGTDFNTLDLADAEFFISISYRDGDQKLIGFEEVEDLFMKIRAYSVKFTYSTTKGLPTIERTKLELQNCNEVVNSTTKTFRGPEAQIGSDTRCIKFQNNEQVISGGFGSDVWQYLELVVEPCDTASGACFTRNIAPGMQYHTGTTDFKAVYDFLQDFTLHLSFMEASGDLSNYEEPIAYNINNLHALKINMYKEKVLDLYMGKFEITSKYGLFYPFQTTVSSINLVDSFIDETHRDPAAEITKFQDETGTEVTKLSPYFTIRVLSSTTSTSIEREYETLITFSGNIGGVAEAVTFVVAFVLYCHISVRYEQKIMNDGLLQEKEDESMTLFEALKKTQIVPFRKKVKKVEVEVLNSNGEIVKLTKEYHLDKKRDKYGYWEVFRFKFCCGCCNKKFHKRQEEYDKDVEHLQKLVDIRSMIKKGATLDVLMGSFLEDHQRKLIPHVNTNTEDEAQKALELTNLEALDILKKRQGKEDIAEKMVNTYILKNIDPFFLEKYNRTDTNSPFKLRLEDLSFNAKNK